MQRRYPLVFGTVNEKLPNAPVAEQSLIFQAVVCDVSGGGGLWLCSEGKRTVALVVSRKYADPRAVNWPLAG